MADAGSSDSDDDYQESLWKALREVELRQQRACDPIVGVTGDPTTKSPSAPEIGGPSNHGGRQTLKRKKSTASLLDFNRLMEDTKKDETGPTFNQLMENAEKKMKLEEYKKMKFEEFKKGYFQQLAKPHQPTESPGSGSSQRAPFKEFVQSLQLVRGVRALE